jgi:acetaldehyde dehydrogenase (acetylating)
VDRSADIDKAARDIVASKSFDCSTICASEQSVVADKPIAAQLIHRMEQEGAYFVDEHQAGLLRQILFTPEGGIIPPRLENLPPTWLHLQVSKFLLVHGCLSQG